MVTFVPEPRAQYGAPTPPFGRTALTALTSERAERLSEVLKALAHPIRLQLVSLVANSPDGEACVCTISAGFAVSGPTISHHLRKLREAGVLVCERRGTWIYYRAVPGVLEPLISALTASASV